MDKQTYDEINALYRRLEYLVNSNYGGLPPHLEAEFGREGFAPFRYTDILDKPYRPYDGDDQ